MTLWVHMPDGETLTDTNTGSFELDDTATMYNQGYHQDSSRGSRGEPYVIEYNGTDTNRENKRNKKAKKVAKKLRKADRGEPDVNAGVEIPPDGGLSAWVVCGGSAVLTTANSVVRVSLHESIETLNDDFGKDNTSSCIKGLTANFDAIYGNDPIAADCLNQNNTAAYDCLSGYLYNSASEFFFADGWQTNQACLEIGSKDIFGCMYTNYPPLREFPPFALFAQFCSYLWSANSTNITIPTTTGPTVGRLSAGNVFSASVTTDDADDEFGTLLNYIFLAVSLFCVLLGGIISVFTGYRITAIIGSILVAVGFLVASFIEEEDELVVQILVGGIAGIGSAFLRVSAIIAVLEYFKDLRMRAIVLSGIGAVLINFLMIGLTFVDSIDFDWRTSFKFQAIPAGISLIAGVFMKPLKLKSGDREGREGDSCSTKCSDYVFSRELFTDGVLYLIMIVYLLDQIGRPIFSEGMQPYLEEKGFNSTQVDIQPFIENGGSLLGLLTLLFWRRQNLADNLTVMAAMDIIVGLLALHVPELSVYAWAVAYSAIFGFTDGVFASMIQDAIPEGFSRRHIRMVAGLLGLIAGIGLVVSGLVADAIDKHSDGKHVAYYFSGGCLIASGIFCVVSRVVVVRKQMSVERRELEEIEFVER